MALTVDIDPQSGFCGGVIRAIGKAEEYLSAAGGGRLYSLGDIVHNEAELGRLSAGGLVTIDKDDFWEISDATGETLLIRAHGEPPETYRRAAELGFSIIDCTCPVVLQLQKSIREAYARLHEEGKSGQLIIFGKIGHAEVLGLLGQVGGDAIVIENRQMLEEALATGSIHLDGPLEIFSQTTKSPAEYAEICAIVESRMALQAGMEPGPFRGTGRLQVHNTICSQVASRHVKLTEFALNHDVVIFVAGKTSSNGKVLCDLCKSVNIRTYHIGYPEELCAEWFRNDDRVGICGATSTPKWLLEDVANAVLALDSPSGDGKFA